MSTVSPTHRTTADHRDPPPDRLMRGDAIARLLEDASDLRNGRARTITAALGRPAEDGLPRRAAPVPVAPTPGPAGTAPVDVADLADLRDYVRPAGFEDGVRVLAERNAAVLAGPPRTGRRTRALATLVEVLRDQRLPVTLVELPAAVLSDPSWRPPPGGRGLLVVDRRGHSAHGPDEAWLTRVADVLRDAGRFLVVVTGPPTGAFAENRPEHLLADLALPDPVEVVRRRVRSAVPGLTDAELTRSTAPTRLAELLAERPDPGFATRAARVVVDALRHGRDLAREVARLRDPREQVAQWLAGDPDAAEVALVTATAVLEGSTYLRVVDAAVALCRDLGGETSLSGPRYARALLAERAWIVRREHEDGPDTLRFRHDDLREAVLAGVWGELDGVRSDLLGWLSGLADHADVEVRARAAAAAGVLVAVDFDHGLHEVLLPWAAGRSATLRQSAALGLDVAGVLGGHATAVWEHVQRWADRRGVPPGSVDLASTAGLAAGGRLGAAEPGRALRVLRSLVRRPGWASLTPVSVGATTLLEAGVTTPVLAALRDWSAGPDDESAVKALAVFTHAAGQADGKGIPVLLADPGAEPDALPALWNRALACEPVRDLAESALRDWIRVADDDHTTRAAVLDVLTGLAARDLGRLRRLLDRWATAEDDPSEAAADFHARLLDARETAT
ncbi:hypothetical protein [Actinosynnema sp. NPDC020468]|uniref:hypothetical protein n=1 Tax=Actinosynnema sp. NPDC020468 TaxID=3154488 RepID=UPI0033F40C8E